MICPHCGLPLREGATNCAKCKSRTGLVLRDVIGLPEGFFRQTSDALKTVPSPPPLKDSRHNLRAYFASLRTTFRVEDRATRRMVFAMAMLIAAILISVLLIMRIDRQPSPVASSASPLPSIEEILRPTPGLRSFSVAERQS